MVCGHAVRESPQGSNQNFNGLGLVVGVWQLVLSQVNSQIVVLQSVSVQMVNYVGEDLGNAAIIVVYKLVWLKSSRMALKYCSSWPQRVLNLNLYNMHKQNQ